MNETITLPVDYLGEVQELALKIVRLGYTYQLHILVEGKTLIFEKDDQGKYRVINTAPDKGDVSKGVLTHNSYTLFETNCTLTIHLVFTGRFYYTSLNSLLCSFTVDFQSGFLRRLIHFLVTGSRKYKSTRLTNRISFIPGNYCPTSECIRRLCSSSRPVTNAGLLLSTVILR